jgi:hypothetical protein
MRHFIFGTIVILSACVTKKEPTEENKIGKDTIEIIPRAASPTEPQTETVIIDFPLDSLLKFDSEVALMNAFGTNVKRSTGYYPEGMGEYPNTLLFPDSENQVEFVWVDDSANFSGLAYIEVHGQKTDWQTIEGITLGTRLKTLETLNQKPFAFYGFGWDYSGTVNWDDGHLFDRKIFVCLDYPGETIPAEFEGLIGDQEIRSDSELAQKANPVVREITMRR